MPVSRRITSAAGSATREYPVLRCEGADHAILLPLAEFGGHGLAGDPELPDQDDIRRRRLLYLLLCLGLPLLCLGKIKLRA
jgi:hypothetical protein